MRPLEGIRVIALEHAVAAPLCTRHLADLGAEVIKIERVGEGDFARGYDDYVKGLSSYFVWLNRGKKSLTLDLKHPDARPILERLIDGADIVVQNLAPGASARMGCAYEALSQRNPRIIVVDVSGYGEGGPFAEKKAYDMLVQAESGVVSVTGSEAEPSRVGISIVDMSTGMYAFSGAMGALLQRERTGVGSGVKVAMFDTMAEWMAYPLYRYGYHGSIVHRAAMTHPIIVPYGAYRCGEGQVVFSIQNEREWKSFCTHILKNASLASDPRFCNNNARRAHEAEVTRLIEAALAGVTSLQAAEMLDQAGIANGRLNDAKALWEHPQLAERDRWREIGTEAGRIQVLRPPFTFSDFEPVMGDVPALGEHTDAVLRGLGLGEEEIATLRAKEVI